MVTKVKKMAGRSNEQRILSTFHYIDLFPVFYTVTVYIKKLQGIKTFKKLDL